MLEKFNSITIARISGFFTLIMFIIVMFIVNPIIDSKNGFGVISLQLAFDKAKGISIVNSWGDEGISNFNHYIFTDYLYALFYSFFFASLLSMLIFRAKQEIYTKYTWIVYLPFFAGMCDWFENTIELLFIKNMSDFSNKLFFIHSVISALKWIALPIVLVYVVLLLKEIFINSNKALEGNC